MQTAETAYSNPAQLLVRLLLAAVALVCGYFALTTLAPIVKMTVAAVLLTYVLDPMVVVMESRGMGRVQATSVVFVALGLVSALLLALIVPAVADEVRSLQAGLNNVHANDLMGRADAYVQEKLWFLGGEGIDLQGLWHRFVVDKINRLFGFVLNAVSLVTYLSVVPFAVYFMLADGRAFKRRFVSLVPNRYFEFTLNMLHKMDLLLGSYLRGLFIESLIIGSLSLIALWALGVRYYVVLGILVGVTNIIPYLGPLAGGLFAMLVALITTGDSTFTFYVGVSQAIVQIIDNVAIKPLLFSKLMHMHPLTVLLVVLVGGEYFGVFGMLLSVPATAILKALALETFKNFRRYFRPPGPDSVLIKPATGA